MKRAMTKNEIGHDTMGQERQQLRDTDAEINNNAIKLLLIDSSLNSGQRDESEQAFVKLRNEIRELWMILGRM